jgi:lipopolysaccharide/colanic/teichoic acid biosynthesis glycosyltransferase
MMQAQISLDLLLKFDPLAVSPMTKDRGAYHFLKRLLDLGISLPGTLFLFPLMLVIAVLIKLDSPGPVLFVQERVGAKRWSGGGFAYWRRTVFRMYKFRTMAAGSNPSIHQDYVRALIHKDREAMAQLQGGQVRIRKLAADPRVTCTGKLLRKLSLDELPQVWNVIRGDMSLVGPRPAIPYELEEYQPWHFRRLEAKPGLTGLWQIKGRSSVGFDEMVGLDLWYIRNSSTWQDLRILFATPLAVLSGRGAV